MPIFWCIVCTGHAVGERQVPAICQGVSDNEFIETIPVMLSGTGPVVSLMCQAPIILSVTSRYLPCCLCQVPPCCQELADAEFGESTRHVVRSCQTLSSVKLSAML